MCMYLDEGGKNGHAALLDREHKEVRRKLDCRRVFGRAAAVAIEDWWPRIPARTRN